jgi:hypothetical protein
LSRIYNYVWYGKYSPPFDDFKEIQKEYKKFSEQIQLD